MGRTLTVEWSAEQTCGQCGEGVFLNHGGVALCSECGHEHAMDRTNLDDSERFEWKWTAQARGEQTLHVVAYI